MVLLETREAPMIKLTRGDILSADTEALVNTVNCVGVMGRGIALQFKKVFPENFRQYKAACDRKEVRPGKMFIYDLNSLHNPHYVINFPTKRHWKGKSRMEDIESGLQALVEEVRTRNIIERVGPSSILTEQGIRAKK
jgi:O-acetyl-ADP-ribose deacetylase (regulator of RNase III)